MEYRYIGFSNDKKIVKGVVSATDDQMATEILDRWGYQVLKLTQIEPFMPVWEKIFPSIFKVKTSTLIIFSRQLAMLLESGTDIVSALELLQAQQANRVFKKIITGIITDLRMGNPLLGAMGKYPDVFPPIYYRCVAVGEQTGGLEAMLRQIAEYLEKEDNVKKSVKGALSYPIIVLVVAVVVIILMVNFVLPTFVGLYRQLGAKMPLATSILMDATDMLRRYGLFILIAIAAAIIATIFYVKTPRGRYMWDKLALRLPLAGGINQLRELSYTCRTIAVLFRAGLPLTETMDIVAEGCGNVLISEALADVRQAMVKGEGISLPMSRHTLFLPMMVQMVRVGEETGNLDSSLMTVAESYEAESSERMHLLIGLIEPALTIVIALVVAFVAISMLSAMYAFYGQFG